MINHEITNVVWRIAGPSILVVRYGQVVDQLTKEVPADQILIRFHSDESELAPLFHDTPKGTHQFEAIIKKLSQKISKSPTPELYFKRAIEYRALRESKECEHDFRAALRLSPDHHFSKMALARLLMTSNKYDETSTFSNELLRPTSTLPRMIEAHFLSAELAEMRGEGAEDLRRYSKRIP